MTNNTENILNSLDRITGAAAPEQFYARLRSKMERAQSGVRQHRSTLKPAYVTLVLCLFLAVNIFLLAGYEARETKQVSNNSGIQAFAKEYLDISQNPIPE